MNAYTHRYHQSMSRLRNAFPHMDMDDAPVPECCPSCTEMSNADDNGRCYVCSEQWRCLGCGKDNEPDHECEEETG